MSTSKSEVWYRGPFSVVELSPRVSLVLLQSSTCGGQVKHDVVIEQASHEVWLEAHPQVCRVVANLLNREFAQVDTVSVETKHRVKLNAREEALLKKIRQHREETKSVKLKGDWYPLVRPVLFSTVEEVEAEKVAFEQGLAVLTNS